MSLKTSSAIPVENYSVVLQSENGTQFGPLNKCRFRIPAHLGYIDFHTSYLQFDLEVKNAKAKMEFSNDMGADILVRSWRVLIGGHVLEEIDHPNVLLKTMKYDYGMDLGQKELNQVLNKEGSARAYQGLNKTEVVDVSTTNPCDKVKVVLDLSFSGVFGSTQTFPVGLTGDVEVEIVFEEARRCLQVVQAGFNPVRITTNNHIARGREVANVPAGGAVADVEFKNATSVYEPAESSTNVVRDCPFSIGQGLKLMGEGGAGGATAQFDQHSTGNITAIAQNAGATATELSVAFADPTTNPVNEASVFMNPLGVEFGATPTTSWDNNGLLTYEVSVPTLALQVAAPPQEYVNQQAQKVASEGYSIDIPTYTCYKSNTFAGIKSAVVDIPCYASRARALLCIGIPEQSLGGNNVLTRPYQMRGDYNDLDTYQFQLGEQREPVRPVNTSNLSTYQHNVAQEQLTELEKALRASGGNVRSLRNHQHNYVIGRALSAYGGSVSLAMKGARLYLNYLQQDLRENADTIQTNKNWFVYCSHIRRMIITQQGIQVLY